MTADRETLAALLTRVEAATGPDRKLEIAIAAALFPLRRLSPELERQLGYRPGALEPEIILPPRLAGRATEPVPNWTESIDAVLALVGRRLPGSLWAVGSMEDGPFARLVVFKERGPAVLFEGLALPTVPLAILAALLKALIAATP